MEKVRFSILRITDGETVVDLLRGNTGRTGIFLKEWRAGRVQYKGGGNWQDNQMAHGRQMVSHVLDNVVETFSLGAVHSSQNRAAELFQPLDMLLDKASAYTEDEWSEEPVWLEMRLGGSLYSQYALIYAGEADNYGEPFGELFANSQILDDVTYAIERGQWQESPPGQGTALQTLDGRSQIIEHITSNYGTEVFVANKDVDTNLTNLYRYDDSATAFSSDLMGSTSVIAFPDPPAADDALYFISRTSVGDSGPFSSIIFNVTTAADDLTLVFEYWDGAAWATLDVDDNSNGLSVLGKVGVYWDQPADWAETTVNTHAGWIVRLRVSAVGGAPVVPILGEVPWYNVTPSVLVPASAVGGTMPALAKMEIYGRSSDIVASGADLGLDRIVVGMRSTARGANFTPYIPFTDSSQKPAAVDTVTVLSGDASIEERPTAPYRRRLEVVQMTTTAADVYTDIARITFATAYINQYRGRFRCFLRMGLEYETGGLSDTYKLKLVFSAGGLSGWTHTTPAYTLVSDSAGGTVDHIADMGPITLPGIGAIGSDALSALTILLQVSNPNSLHVSATLVPYEVILIPTDEWTGEFYNPNTENPGSFEYGDLLTVDSLARPKDDIRSLLYDSSGAVEGTYQVAASGPLLLRPNAEQKFWFLMARHYRYGSLITNPFRWMSLHESGVSVKISAVNRYHGLRGDQ